MTGSRDEWRFADVVVETATFRLLRGGTQVRIEPRALQVLIYLIEQRDRVVTKQELLDELWTGTAVTENALTRTVAQVRRVLGDDLQSPRYIQTVPTRGYRFIATIEETARSAPAVPPAAKRRWPVAALIAAGLAMTALFVLVADGLRLQQPRKKFRPLGLQAAQTIVAGRPLRPDARLQSHPAFSPDGLRLAYSYEVDGTPHIFTSSASGADEQQITSGDGETQPSWSPDGKSIAYVSIRRGGIWVAPLDGGEPRRLTASGSRPSWSPDGDEIAFQTSEIMEFGWTAFEALPPSTIRIVSVRTGREEPLTRSGAPPGGHGAPSWRGDGRRLTFSSCDIEQCAIFTIARDGSDLAMIMTDGRRLASPLFIPGGSAVAFLLGRYNNSALLSAPVDQNGHLAGPAARLRETNPGVMQHLAMSRDGRRFAWTLAEESSDLFSIPTAGVAGEPQQLTHNPTMRATFPLFSPDGAKIAWCAVAAGEDSGVWVMNADGRNAKPVAVGAGLKQHTGWMPGGRDILYSTWAEGPAVLRASTIGGASDMVARPPRDASAPVLGPDGRTLAFNRTIDGIASVWIGSKRLAEDRDLARFPVWSPSGRLLALQVRRPEGSAIGIVNAAGGALRVIAEGRGEAQPYGFSPDEREIAFAGRRDGVWNIYAVGVKGGTPRPLTDNRSVTRWLRSPTWSPAGDRIVYEAGTPSANVWVSQ